MPAISKKEARVVAGLLGTYITSMMEAPSQKQMELETELSQLPESALNARAALTAQIDALKAEENNDLQDFENLRLRLEKAASGQASTAQKKPRKTRLGDAMRAITEAIIAAGQPLDIDGIAAATKRSKGSLKRSLESGCKRGDIVLRDDGKYLVAKPAPAAPTEAQPAEVGSAA